MATKLRPWSPAEERFGNVVIRLMSSLNVWAYRATRGRVGGKFLRGAPVLLLTTTGRKSGEKRTAPVLYLRDGERFVVVASKGGFTHHPAWYLNLEAKPDAELELGAERFAVTARRASDEEKAKLWPKLVAMYKDFQDYQDRTERNIPVLILSRR
ncbi:MAG TPA: nitroreductase family deazaflavin-dependent oxidoreductase [Myxococcota bacterium]|jgi:deazaflavin-dependent oxidoreductase (nitroreductase family)|nr:nitroreductase family deazaflavin-dependent oxidoreductase [Myxococcota bacterium]